MSLASLQAPETTDHRDQGSRPPDRRVVRRVRSCRSSTCSICMEDVCTAANTDRGDVVLTVCDHAFHKTCWDAFDANTEHLQVTAHISNGSDGKVHRSADRHALPLLPHKEAFGAPLCLKSVRFCQLRLQERERVLYNRHFHNSLFSRDVQAVGAHDGVRVGQERCEPIVSFLVRDEKK